MTTFHSSDWHLGHERIIPLSGRPFTSVAEMNETIIENTNEVVTEKHRLVIQGDVCMGQFVESVKLLSRLRAKEVIIMPGNHDRFSLAYHQKSDEKREAARFPYMSQGNNMIVLRDQVPSVWQHYDLGYETNHPLSVAIFSHYPESGDSHGEDRHPELRPVGYDAPIIHGHVHEKWKTNGHQFNVGVDVHDFKPVHEDELVAWVESL